MEPDAILERVRHFHGIIARPEQFLSPKSIFPWRARFTLEHYREKGFTGGLFQQWNMFPRNCLTLDYTPETLEAVLDRFYQWLDGPSTTARITVDGKTVRVFSTEGGKP